MTCKHVIWDWNGTVLDDFTITARITIDALADLGRPGITEADIRASYQRPLSNYFDALIGRAALEHELRHLGDSYVQRYGAVMATLPLAADARDALATVGAVASQSLLSMAPHAQILELIGLHGLEAHFMLVEGFNGTGHPSKRESLAAHCRRLNLPFDRCWLIGDTVDDFDAANSLGIRTVLVTTGMQGAAALAATGSPLAHSLADAAQLIITAA